MIKVLERLTLQLQRLHDRSLPAVISVAGSARHFNLLDRNHFSGRGVQGQVHLAIGTLTDKLTTDPAEDSF